MTTVNTMKVVKIELFNQNVKFHVVHQTLKKLFHLELKRSNIFINIPCMKLLSICRCLSRIVFLTYCYKECYFFFLDSQ